MMRFAKWAVIGVVALASAVAGAATQDDAAMAKLQKKQPRVRYDAAFLSDALDILHDMTGVNFVVNWSALETFSIKKDTPVSMEFDNVSGADTLDVMCRLAGGGKMAWVVRDGVVEVSTRAEMARKAGASKTYSGIGIGLARPEVRA
jgi:hypothetical protein